MSDNNELSEVFNAKLVRNNVVFDHDIESDLFNKGYGEKNDKKIIFSDYEILFLVYIGKLNVLYRKKKLSFHNIVDIFSKTDEKLWTKFLIFRDLRSRGYILKEGFGLGIDFRIYERGKYGDKPSKYVVFAINEGTETDSLEVYNIINKISRMGKEPIIAVIERRGEIIYYKVSKMVFNKLD